MIDFEIGDNMSKYYIYNCLIKNDINLVWIATLLSLFHCVAFYSHQSFVPTAIVVISFIISSLALGISLKTKTVLNLKQNVSMSLLSAVTLVGFNSMLNQSNNISGIFITALNIGLIIFSIVNIKELFHTVKVDNLVGNNQSIGALEASEIITLYKLSIYEVIRLHNNGYRYEKNSIFYDFKINTVITKNYEFVSMDDGKSYSLINLALHCKDNDINIIKITRNDFEVFKMAMI